MWKTNGLQIEALDRGKGAIYSEIAVDDRLGESTANKRSANDV